MLGIQNTTAKLQSLFSEEYMKSSWEIYFRQDSSVIFYDLASLGRSEAWLVLH
jgi:hypothetical protein